MKNTDKNNLAEAGAECAAVVSEDAKSENRTRIECFTLIETLLKKYRGKQKEVGATIDELCLRGIAKGCYQNYAMLSDMLTLLGAFEKAVKAGESDV